MHPHVPDRLYCVRELVGMTLDDWQSVPVVQVRACDLVPTQSCLVIDRLIALTEGGQREAGDICGHAIFFNGRLYIHDGHHDWALRWLREEQYVPVRVKRIEVACADPCQCECE